MEIIIKNLEKKYNDNIIFSNVNLEFKSGRVYGIIGRNGSGKSVFLKTICGFLSPNKGDVMVNGKSILCNDFFIPNTRVMIEKPTFIDELTGLDNLKLLSSIQNLIGDDIIIEMLKKVGLYDDMNKKYMHYSLGMKQKLAIVQVLMEDPDIMILDEPFNGLDKESYKKMMEIFKEEKKRGKLIIIATHIESDLTNLCDEVYEIEAGCITKKHD